MSYVYMLLEYADGSRHEFGTKRAPQPCPACSAADRYIHPTECRDPENCGRFDYQCGCRSASAISLAEVRQIPHADGCANQERR